MTTIVQPSPVWIARVQEYFAEEGLRQTTREEFEAIPGDLRAGIPHLQDRDAPFGFRPPTEAEITNFYDRLAPHYDALTMVQYDLEVRSTAWLAEHIEQLDPRRMIDAGVGTGITLLFLEHWLMRQPVASLWGYDCSTAMYLRTEERRIERLRRGHLWRAGLLCSSHAQMPTAYRYPLKQLVDADELENTDVRQDDADLLYTKCSFNAGVYELPMFDDASMPSAAREDFYGNDPTMQEWRSNLKAFATVLRPGGTYIHIGVLADGPHDALATLADETGFDCTTPEPLWFEERPAPPDFRAECMAHLDGAEIPAAYREVAVQRRWNWIAPALGALIFQRR